MQRLDGGSVLYLRYAHLCTYGFPFPIICRQLRSTSPASWWRVLGWVRSRPRSPRGFRFISVSIIIPPTPRSAPHTGLQALFYTKEEIGLRIAVYNGFAAAAGAFGGLVAFAIQQAQLAIPNWKLLFLVEGAPSVLVGLLAFVILPNRPEDTSMFTQEERHVALNRLVRSGKPDVGRVLRKS